MSGIGEKATQEQQDQRSGGSHMGGVIFLLNDLPFDLEDEYDDEDLLYSVENLAATYLMPVAEVLSSRFNDSGFIRAIYVKFGPMGYYELNPNSKPIIQPALFEAQLRDLFRTGIVSNPSNNGVPFWRKITDLSTLLSDLPANSRKIGCLHGPGSQEFRDLRDYIKTDSDEQNYVFVVGQIDNQEIQAYIDDYVQVSDYDLIAAYCLDSIMSIMQAKWPFKRTK